MSFAELTEEAEREGVVGLEVLAWKPGDPRPEFFAGERGDRPSIRRRAGRPPHEDGTSPPRHARSSVLRVRRDRRRERSYRRSGRSDRRRTGCRSPRMPVRRCTRHDDGRSSDSVDSYTKRIPDAAWTASPSAKAALLRGLWDGDGSWSLISGGPSVVLEYGTVSRELADGMLRLLGEFGIVGRLKVGRASKSTTDTYWLVISGAAQVEEALFLFPEDEQAIIRASFEGQQRRIQPTGYRRLGKGVAWARVTGTDRQPYQGPVYSVEVPDAGTVVTTHGLVAHNCFPKDSRALLYIAQEAGYEFGLLEGVIEVNDEQFDRVADKVVQMAGGSVDGRKIAIWGLTFKANTDDLRESPSLQILRRLLAAGANVTAYDPTVTEPLADYPEVEIAPDPVCRRRGCDRAGRAHGVGRVQVARPRQGGRRHGRAASARRAQPARPHLAGAPRVRVPGHRTQLMARIVVTGGAGFLGSHICEALLERGDEVVAVDNLITGSVDNIEHLFERREFSFIEHDVSQYVRVPGDVDAVMHFASPASPKDYLEKPIQTLEGRQPRHAQHARAGQGEERDLHAGFDERGVRRSRGASATRDLLGSREPHRPAGRVRRSQALRRSHDDGVPPLPRSRRPHRSHLQYVRPSDEGAGRPRGVELPDPGDRGQADHALRRRAARPAASAS